MLGNRVQGYMANDKEILRGFDPKDINDVLFSFESNTDKDGEFKTSMGFNEEEMSKSEKNKLKKVSSQLKKSVKAHDKQSKTIDSIISEADTSKLTDDEKKELKFHLAQFKKGNIDYEDIMNVLDQFGLNENGHVDDYADEIEEGHTMSDNEADLEAGVKGNMDAFTEENMSSDDKEGEAIKIIKNMDPKTKKEFLKKLSKMGMGQLDEAVAEEESVGQYIIDYYRNPNKPEEMYVTDDIVIEYFKTHPDWDLIWGKSYEDGLEDFKEFFSANYDYMFDDARLDEEDKDKKELPDSIKKAEQDQIEKDARKSRGDIKEDMDEDSLNEVRKHFKRFMFDKYQ